MKIAVTGCAGFIGSAVAASLLDQGHLVVGIDSLTNDVYPASYKLRRLEGLLCRPNFSFHQISIHEEDLDALLEGVEVVINEAASPGLVLSWTHYENYVNNNLTASFALAAAMQRSGVRRLVHASTSSVYGAIATGGEDNPTNPISPYGVTKLAAEKALAAWAEESNLQLTILRYFSVYGPSQRPDMAYEIFCKRLLSNEPLEVYGDGHQSRSNTYIRDIVDATLAAAYIPEGLGAMNICGGEPIQLLDAIEILGDELGVEPRIEFLAPRRGDQKVTQGNYELAENLLNWQPRTAPEDGLREQARSAMNRFTNAGDSG